MLTVIVPVYNEKEFLRLILNKLVKIKIKKLQIIIVDDGSNDGTTEILKKLYLKNKKINKIIFHKKKFWKRSSNQISTKIYQRKICCNSRC